MDTFIVLLIVGGAIGYLVRRGLKTLLGRDENACQCGCSGCGQAASCDRDQMAPLDACDRQGKAL